MPRSSAQPRLAAVVYRATKTFIRLVLFRWFRVRVVGVEHLNTPGPAVIAPVHRSNLDSPLIAAAANRRMRFLAKDSLFANRMLGWYFRALGAFPVRRGAADREALRGSLSILEAGDPLLVFPEGTRQAGPEVGEMFGGMAYLAIKAGAAVVPVGIAGTEAAMPKGAKGLRRVRVAIVAGPPVPPPDGARVSRSARDAFTGEVRAGLQLAFDQAHALIA